MKKHLEKIREDEGFTLIEMLIVIMIVSLLLLLVMTNVGGVQKTVKNTTDAGIIQTVESQKVIYEMEMGKPGTPKDLWKEKYINEEQFNAYEKAITTAAKPPKDPA